MKRGSTGKRHNTPPEKRLIVVRVIRRYAKNGSSPRNTVSRQGLARPPA